MLGETFVVLDSSMRSQGEVKMDDLERSVLHLMQEVIKKYDISLYGFPVSIGFSASGKVLVRHSLNSDINRFDTVEEALQYIKNTIEGMLEAIERQIKK